MITNFRKKQKSSDFKRKVLYIAGTVLLLTISVFFVSWDIKIYKEKQRISYDIAEYQKKIGDIKFRNQNLEAGIAQTGNPDYIEKVAREQLDMQKQGETVVSFIVPKKEPSENELVEDFFGAKAWLLGAWDSVRNFFKQEN